MKAVQPVATKVRTSYEIRSSPKKKLPSHKNARSPTKRLVDMKNSNEKAQIKTYQKKDNTNILYNIKPGQAYLVRKEDFGKMTEQEF